MLPTLVPSARFLAFPLLLSVVDRPTMALSARLPCHPAQMFAQEVQYYFALCHPTVTTLFLPLLSFSPSLCTSLIRLLLLHVDRSGLWITEIEKAYLNVPQRL